MLKNKKCNNCGTPLDKDYEFCPECGAPIQKKESSWKEKIKKIVVGYLILSVVVYVIFMLFVGGEDEEEHGEQVRRVLLIVLLSHRRTDKVVVDIHHEHLHSSDESPRCIALLVSLLIPARA